MSKSRLKTCCLVSILATLPLTSFAKSISALNHAGEFGPIHSTQINTGGKVALPTRVSLGIGKGDSTNCSVVYQRTETIYFDDGDTYLTYGEALTGEFGEGFSCVKETYKLMDGKISTITYKISAESSPVYDKAEPSVQIADLS